MTTAARGILIALGAGIAGVVCLGSAFGHSGGGPTDARVARELRHGGLVVLLRHTAADDSAPAADGCGGQANLTSEGRGQALAIRRGLADVRAVVGSVLASPLCRARETARLVAPGAAQTVRACLVRTASDGAEAWRRKLHEVRQLLGWRPRAGTNRLVVTHSEVISATTGEDVDQGDALVLRPLGRGRFALLGRIAPDDWKRLEAPAG
jgi:phosphohistidine phosphatase SixA